MLTSMLQGIIDVFAGICAVIVSMLPQSPFQQVSAIVLDSQLLQLIAWLIPFPQILLTLGDWLAAVALYYAIMIILRWVKALE